MEIEIEIEGASLEDLFIDCLICLLLVAGETEEVN